MTGQQALNQREVPPTTPRLSVGARVDVLARTMDRITAQLAHLTEAINTDAVELHLDVAQQMEADGDSVLDPAESISQESGSKGVAETESELPHNDLYKDSEECSPKSQAVKRRKG